MCGSFLLHLLNDVWNKNSDVVSSFAVNDNELNEKNKERKKETSGNVQELDTNKQLLMFVTGPAGAGKSTATEVAQQFCFESCRSMDMYGEKIHFYSLP